MIRCNSCGSNINEGAIFCTCCGSKIQRIEYTSRQKVYEGNIHICPECGGRIEAFSLFCRFCGHEFRDTKSSKAVSDFANYIIQWEASPITNMEGTASRNKNNRASQIEVANQISNYIRTYSVPNNKEDMLEFMFLASSNINEHALYPHERERASAWYAKAEQVFYKARIAYYSDSDFALFEQAYNGATVKYQNAMNALELRKKKKTSKVLLIVGISVGGYFLLILMGILPALILSCSGQL